MGLDIIKQLSVDFYETRYISINAKQYDNSSRFIELTCFNQGTLYPIDNVYNYAFIRYRKSDDLNTFNCCNITEDGKIVIELTEQMLACEGRSYADLVIVHNEPIPSDSIEINHGELLTNETTSIVSTMLFCVNVVGVAVDNNEIESSYEYDALNELLLKATEDYTYIIKMCKISEDNAKVSELNSKESEENAKDSENKAKVSETNAKTSETKAKTSETKAKTSENNAKASETNAKTSETNALASETKAKTSETNAKKSETNASVSASNSSEYANESYNNSLLSKSYAVGETGVRVDEDNDNAKYYYYKTKGINDALNGVFSPQGTIAFADLKTVVKNVGYVYHIRDEFVTDETFKSGAGIERKAGTNVYYTADGYWDCFIWETVGGTLIVSDDDEGNVKISGFYDASQISEISE